MKYKYSKQMVEFRICHPIFHSQENQVAAVTLKPEVRVMMMLDLSVKIIRNQLLSSHPFNVLAVQPTAQ